MISQMLRPLHIALSFLTVFTVKSEPPPEMAEIGRVAWAFPVVGLGVGTLLGTVWILSASHLPPALAAVVTVGLWIVLTGGLHLDGWTDCCDALPTALPPERRYAILKDPRVGTFGALGLLLLLAVKTAALTDPALPLIVVVLAPAVGRAVMVLVAYDARHGGEGMAAMFISGLDSRSLYWVALIGLAPVILMGWSGVAAAAGAYLGARWLRNLAESRLPTVNGDVIGATCELSETLFIFIASIR
jgi:adenosylcobinamide-GDP ribazoletransferase